LNNLKLFKKIDLNSNLWIGALVFSILALIYSPDDLLLKIVILIFSMISVFCIFSNVERKKELAAIIKIDVSLVYLYQKNKLLTKEQFYQIIKNTEIELDFDFLNVFKKRQKTNWTESLRRTVFERLQIINNPVYSVYLSASLNYLTKKEISTLNKKLSFYES